MKLVMQIALGVLLAYCVLVGYNYTVDSIQQVDNAVRILDGYSRAD